MNNLQLLGIVTLAVAAGYFLPHPAPGEHRANDPQPRVFRPSPPPRERSTAPGTIAEAPPILPVSREFRDLLDQPSVFDTLHLAFGMAAAADRVTLERLLDEAVAQSDPLLQFHVADIFIEKLTADDPDRALSYAESLPPGEVQMHLLASILGSWARGDEERALVYYRSISNLEIKRLIAANFIRDASLSEAFRGAVIDALGAYGEELSRSVLRRGQPAEESFRLALRESGSRERGDLYQQALRWFRQNPEAALDDVLALPVQKKRSYLLQVMLGDLTTRDPEQAVALMMLHAAADPAVQQSVLGRYARQDPIAARPHVEAFTERHDSPHVMSEMLASWVLQEPEAATAYAEALVPQLREQVLHNMASAYLRESPRAALEWMLTVDAGRENLLSSTLHQFNEATAQTAQTMLAETADSRKREMLIEGVALYRAENDPPMALRWLEQHPEHSKYDSLYAHALQSWANRDPHSAAAALEQRWYEPEMVQSFRSIAWSWGRREPEEAIAWARSLPASAGGEAAVSALVEMNARRDPELARGLYDTLPGGENRDRAGATLANQLAGGDPDRMRDIMTELGMSEAAIASYLLVWSR